MEPPRTSQFKTSASRVVFVSWAMLLLGVSIRVFSSRADPSEEPPPAQWLSVSGLAASPDGGTLYAASSTVPEVLAIDVASQRVRQVVSLPGGSTGLVLSPDGRRLYACCAGSAPQVCLVDLSAGQVVGAFPA